MSDERSNPRSDDTHQPGTPRPGGEIPPDAKVRPTRGGAGVGGGSAPAVSVVIPLHNAEGTIAETLASLQSQTFTNWKAVIVDDGSSDNSAAIVARMAERDTRLTLLHQPQRGVSAARNAGIDAADGRSILLLDADDWMLPGGLEALHDAAQRAEGAAFGDFDLCDERGRVLGRQTARYRTVGLQELLGSVFFVVHGHLVPRTVYRPPAGSGLPALRFDSSLPVVEDTDMWLRMAEAGVRWTHCGEVVAGYRIRRSSRSADLPGMLSCTARVYASAYARAQAAAAGGLNAVDCGEKRLSEVIGRAAFSYATRRVLVLADHGAPAGDAASAGAALVEASPGWKQITPEQAARAAFHGVMLALGQPPADFGEAEWTTALRRWWKEAQRRNWLPVGGAEQAERSLESLIVASRSLGS
ncbi:MAG: glycosyltransferase family 2 protein [Phycisphaerales bacterium]|jgi:hypothetical protein|nr:glycosyltransferase family 2 protein [Phycisphaerales bacterium]